MILSGASRPPAREKIALETTMTTETAPAPEDIPAEIEQQYEGEWIAWDCEMRQVIAHDVDPNKLVAPTDKAFDAGHLIYFRHILPPDAIIVGGF